MSRFPVSILLDTDIDSDVDDAGALAVLHGYVQSGRARVIAMCASALGPYQTPAIDAINTYYGLPDLPIGTDKSDEFCNEWALRYNQFLAETYPHRPIDGASAPEAVRVYREALAAEPDGSVVLVMIGTMNNLESVLISGPDDLSPLSGMELVSRKVKFFSIMAGEFPSSLPHTQEHNISEAIRSARYVAAHCPVPIVYAGWELGAAVMTGGKRHLMEPDNPVRLSYDRYCGDGNRQSWDLISVVYAVEGCGDFWEKRHGRILIHEDGHNEWMDDPAGRDAYLVARMEPALVAEAIDTRMIAAKKHI